LLKISQPELAARVGVTPITIKMIEGGRLKLSPKLANQLAIYLQVNPEQLIKNYEPETPRDALGDPWTPKTFKAGRKPTKAEIKKEVRAGARLIEALLLDSVRQASFYVVSYSVRVALAQLRNDFSLTRPVQASKSVELRQASPGSGNAGKRSSGPQRGPSVQQSRRHA
jgi:transcriptional regulator with XRE-family HTH domain